MSKSPVRITFKLAPMFAINAHKSVTVTVDRDEWNVWDQQDREAFIREEAERILNEQVDVGIEFEDPADDPQH